jgi:hypothetical protein
MEMGPGNASMVHMVIGEVWYVLNLVQLYYLRLSMSSIATDIPTLLLVYHQSLHHMREFVSELRSHDVTFETSRDILSKWVHQPYLLTGGWSDWEDLCSVEVERWDSIR